MNSRVFQKSAGQTSTQALFLKMLDEHSTDSCINVNNYKFLTTLTIFGAAVKILYTLHVLLNKHPNKKVNPIDIENGKTYDV